MTRKDGRTEEGKERNLQSSNVPIFQFFLFCFRNSVFGIFNYLIRGCQLSVGTLFYRDVETESVAASFHIVSTPGNTQPKQLTFVKRVRDFFRFFGTNIPFYCEGTESFHISVAVLSLPDGGGYTFRCFFCREVLVIIKQVESSCCLTSTDTDVQRKCTAFKRRGINLYDGVVLMRNRNCFRPPSRPQSSRDPPAHASERTRRSLQNG